MLNLHVNVSFKMGLNDALLWLLCN